MNEETTILSKVEGGTKTNGSSSIFNVSIRGWIAVLAIVTICVLAVMQIAVTEPLYTLSVSIVAFYYGQNIKQKVE